MNALLLRHDPPASLSPQAVGFLALRADRAEPCWASFTRAGLFINAFPAGTSRELAAAMLATDGYLLEQDGSVVPVGAACR